MTKRADELLLRLPEMSTDEAQLALLQLQEDTQRDDLIAQIHGRVKQMQEQDELRSRVGLRRPDY